MNVNVLQFLLFGSFLVEIHYGASVIRETEFQHGIPNPDELPLILLVWLMAQSLHHNIWSEMKDVSNLTNKYASLNLKFNAVIGVLRSGTFLLSSSTDACVSKWNGAALLSAGRWLDAIVAPNGAKYWNNLETLKNYFSIDHFTFGECVLMLWSL